MITGRPSLTAEQEAEEAIDLVAFGVELLRRRAAAASPELPRNSGARRTGSKRALLEEIAKTGRRW